MQEYSLNSKKTWLQTKIELEQEFARWGVVDYVVTPASQNAVSVRYVLRGKEIILNMDKQYNAKDNLRVILFTIKSLRLNELRGMSEIFESAYLQLNAPVLEKDPWDVLGLPRGTTLPVCEAQFKELAKTAHPDRGGSAEKFQELTKAIEQIRERSK